MSNRIHEELNIDQAIVPVSQAAAGNTTSAYFAKPKYGALDFVVLAGALAAAKKLTIQVYKADDASGTNATELTDYKVIHTAPTGGDASSTTVISIDPADMPNYAAIKVTNDAAAAVLIGAIALTRKTVCE